MIVDRGLQKLDAEFALRGFWNLRFPQMHDILWIAERLDQNGTHLSSRVFRCVDFRRAFSALAFMAAPDCGRADALSRFAIIEKFRYRTIFSSMTRLKFRPNERH